MINRLKNYLKLRWAETSNERFANYLRKKNIKVGTNVHFANHPSRVHIDTTRPSLVEIGDDVTFADNFALLTHDFITRNFRVLYNDFLPSSGKVVIGNNVFFNTNCTVLKNVTIGDNCIFGYGATVMKDIPANSVAVGTPAKVICTVEEYYKKRCNESIEEAFVYARSIKERFRRMPVIEDFWEEFPLFVSGNEIDNYPVFFKKQLGNALNHWTKNHKALFQNFDEFIEHAFARK